jgi:GTP cyclohydrolase I
MREFLNAPARGEQFWPDVGHGLTCIVGAADSVKWPSQINNHVAAQHALRLADHPVPDLAAAEQAAAAFLQALGIRLSGHTLPDTPARMARAYAELFTPEPFEVTTFPNHEGYDELVLARDIPLRSVCEHHLLPFIGTACVGYLPGERIIGLSKLARVVEHFACRPQVQERLTKQVADWLTDHLEPRAVGVVICAEHTCMTLRGARATGSTTVTSTLLGTLRDDSRSRSEFFALAGVGGRVNRI